MSEGLLLLVAFAVWVIVARFVLPRLGVQT